MDNVKDNLNVSGRFQLYEDDVLIVDRKNLVTTIGAQLYAKLLSGDTTDIPNFLSLDGVDSVYDKDSVVISEILLKDKAKKVVEGNKIIYDFIISGDEAIAQIFGFALTNNPQNGETTNFGKVYTNLINQTFNHAAGKIIRIIWTIEVLA